ncbi:cysteine desulfurase family protein [Limibacter armeniacum]|uniref:cysteine desulfurase family protein n=1 Tax=Limibacter armeniacum TaxID=466084 RepID=UPI002FE5F738
MKVYFDNAATTAIDQEVLDTMLPHMQNTFGNPSSTHSFGREAKATLEMARKQVAKAINALPGEVYFTSGGTESDNTAIRGLIKAYGINHIITTLIEHHAVSHTVEELEKTGQVSVTYLKVNEQGEIDFNELEEKLKEYPNSLVTLMHANNEIGNLLDLPKVGALCEQYGAKLHSDTVQTVGHFMIDVKELKVDTLAGSAHKFHGPKGVGFLYVRKGSKMQPLITGGGQEREMRSGTENLGSIVGLGKALELAIEHMDQHTAYIKELKEYMKGQLLEKIEGVTFNGLSGDLENSLYTVLNVSLPPIAQKDMLLFMLDLNGVAVSGGSACSSGAQQGSHVIAELGGDPERTSIRFSFSKYNRKEEVDFAIEQLLKVIS